MRKLIIAAAVLVALAACSSPEPPAEPKAEESEGVQIAEAPEPAPEISAFDALEQSALDGDYQAQRNLAYTLSTGVPNNPVLACAWRIVIEGGKDPDDPAREA